MTSDLTSTSDIEAWYAVQRPATPPSPTRRVGGPP